MESSGSYNHWHGSGQAGAPNGSFKLSEFLSEYVGCSLGYESIFSDNEHPRVHSLVSKNVLQ